MHHLCSTQRDRKNAFKNQTKKRHREKRQPSTSQMAQISGVILRVLARVGEKGGGGRGEAEGVGGEDGRREGLRAEEGMEKPASSRERG